MVPYKIFVWGPTKQKLKALLVLSGGNEKIIWPTDRKRAPVFFGPPKKILRSKQGPLIQFDGSLYILGGPLS